MLRAALRAGRVKPELRANLETIADPAKEVANAADIKANLSKLWASDPASRELAGRVAIKQLELRRQFLGKQYSQILRDHAHVNPTAQPDETVLLLTLCAAREADADALDRWSGNVGKPNA